MWSNWSKSIVWIVSAVQRLDHVDSGRGQNGRFRGQNSPRAPPSGRIGAYCSRPGAHTAQISSANNPCARAYTCARGRARVVFGKNDGQSETICPHLADFFRTHPSRTRVHTRTRARKGSVPRDRTRRGPNPCTPSRFLQAAPLTRAYARAGKGAVV